MQLKKIFFLWPLIFIFLCGCVRLDESMGVFFPKELKELQYVQTQFSAFWWNFVVVEPQKGSADFESAQKICEKFKTHLDQELRMVFCGSDSATQKILSSWSQDFVLRTEFDKDFERKNISFLQSTMAQVSFVSDQQILNVLRLDPYQSWSELIELSKNSFLSSYTRKNGFLYDEESKRIVLPLQFQTSPRMISVQPIIDILDDYPQAMLIGSHGSTFRNEKQVKEDLALVSLISGIIFVLFIFFLVIKSRINTVFLALPVLISLYLATLLTQCFYGSIHGLTLAFGSGIVGLALDYGLHGAFGSESKQTWKSNVIGLLTTLCGVGILLLSGIPLIRQMMIFSIIGLLFGFSIFYILFRYWPEHFKIKSINFVLPQFKFSKIILGAIFIFGVIGASKIQMTMDLRKLSFVSDRESELMTWLFKKNKQEPYLLMQDFESALVNYPNEAIWVKENKIDYDGIGKYLPSIQQQQKNFESWQNQGCTDFIKTTSATQKIFQPYFNQFCDSSKNQVTIGELAALLKSKEYLSHLIGEQQILTIFNSRNEAEAELIKKTYPEAKSLLQAVKNFSISLEKDLVWMIPITLLLTILILALYYRSALAVFTSLLPFLTGLCLYFSVSQVLNLEIDLVSILGLVMVFGFSIDYGVFSTDAHLFSHNNVDEVKGVYSALTFAAITNILGFFPMLFAGHPVLLKLGAALFYGTAGTYLGTVYGVYPIYMRKKVK